MAPLYLFDSQIIDVECILLNYNQPFCTTGTQYVTFCLLIAIAVCLGALNTSISTRINSWLSAHTFCHLNTLDHVISNMKISMTQSAWLSRDPPFRMRFDGTHLANYWSADNGHGYSDGRESPPNRSQESYSGLAHRFASNILLRSFPEIHLRHFNVCAVGSQKKWCHFDSPAKGANSAQSGLVGSLPVNGTNRIIKCSIARNETTFAS